MTRWYDRFKNINALIIACEDLPNAVRESIGNKFKSCATYYKYRGGAQDEEFKSLGRDVVLGLYQSKKRRRWYDTCPLFHEGLNNIRVSLSEQALRKLNTRCAEVVRRINVLKYEYPRDPDRLAYAIISYLNATPMIEIRDQEGFLYRQAQD